MGGEWVDGWVGDPPTPTPKTKPRKPKSWTEFSQVGNTFSLIKVTDFGIQRTTRKRHPKSEKLEELLPTPNPEEAVPSQAQAKPKPSPPPNNP